MSKKELDQINDIIEILDVILLNTPLVAFSRSIDGHYKFAKGCVEDIFGVSAEDILSEKITWIDLIYEEDKKFVLENMFDSLKNKDKSNIVEFRVKMPDGSLKWRRRIGKYFKDGDVWLTAGVVVDIDKEKRGELLSKEMVSKFYDTSNQIEEGLVILNKSYEIQFINEYALKLLSLKEPEIENVLVDDLFIFDNKEKLTEKISNTVVKGFRLRLGLLSQESVFVKSGKKVIPVELKASKGKDEIIYVSFSDISEIIAYEQKLLEQTKKLESINKNLESIVKSEIDIRLKHENMISHQRKIADMGRLISSIAHRWRQPLNGLSLNIQYILQMYDAGELNRKELLEVHDYCIESINYMSDMIDKFGGLFIQNKNLSSINLVDKIYEITELYMAALLSQNIIFTQKVRTEENSFISFEEAIVDETFKRNFEIDCYEDQIFNIIVNLLSNSRDSIADRQNAASEFQGTIKLTLCLQGDHIVIEIADNGLGIGKDAAEHIFEPYFTTKDEGKGIGMGLYLSKIYIENTMGGQIGFENLSNGCKFAISIPTNQAKELK